MRRRVAIVRVVVAARALAAASSTTVAVRMLGASGAAAAERHRLVGAAPWVERLIAAAFAAHTFPYAATTERRMTQPVVTAVSQFPSLVAIPAPVRSARADARALLVPPTSRARRATWLVPLERPVRAMAAATRWGRKFQWVTAAIRVCAPGAVPAPIGPALPLRAPTAAQRARHRLVVRRRRVVPTVRVRPVARLARSAAASPAVLRRSVVVPWNVEPAFQQIPLCPVR